MLNLYKKRGETPLQRLERWKSDNPEYEKIPLSYAGRLDPMAEGVMIVLEGEENNEREKYLGLDKEYEFEVLFGFETDTYDLLGKLKASLKQQSLTGTHNFVLKICSDSDQSSVRPFKDSVSETLTKHFPIGKIEQSYPPYSSKTINGKPLFQWSREGKIGEIEIPKHEVEIFDLEFLGMREISVKDLLKEIEERVAEVAGDFRQEEILNAWKNALLPLQTDSNLHATFNIASFKISVSSGFYIRTFAHDLGLKLNIAALAYGIRRISVGKFVVKESKR